MKPRCSGVGCKRMANRHCWEITDSQREEIFRHYWKDLDKEQKKMFICENVLEDYTARMKDIASVCKKKGKVIELKDYRREITFRYHFPINGQKLQVCQTMFVGTLCVAEKSVRVVVKGGFGLLQDSTYNAGLFEGGEQPKVYSKKLPVKKEFLSDEESSTEEDSESADDLCDDSSSENDSSSEEVLPKKNRKETCIPDAGRSWYRKKDKVSMKERCSGCKKQCSEITDAHRKSIFHHFWNNLDMKGKDDYVRDLVKVDKTVRAKMIESAFEKSGNPLDKEEISSRLCFKYFLPKGLGKEKVQVCCGMFEGTLSIGSSKIKRIISG